MIYELLIFHDTADRSQLTTDNTFHLSYSAGVKYYDTKVDSPNKELTWVVGSGEFSPAVEEALIGTLTYFIFQKIYTFADTSTFDKFINVDMWT